MIIVTGGAGFIGSTLVWKLNKLGIENIIIVDEFGKDDKYRNLISLKFLDVIDKDDFKDKASDFFKKNKVDTIFHLGACSSTTELDVNFLLKNNTEYSKLLCMQAVENNIRFINASSGATYGSGKQGYSDDESKLENLIPLNPYGYSKHLFDLWAKHNDYLDKIASLKYFNVYGPNEYHKKDMMSVVNKCFYQIKETGKARLFKTTSTEYGDGEQRRDFIYVKDAVDMTIFFYDNKTVNGIYNLGTRSEEQKWHQ
jgi:ADP-L-glycero-D-manno-heptose 6-epimerase